MSCWVWRGFNPCLWPCNLRFDDAGVAQAASKVVAGNPSASAPQQGNTQMACIATLVWMRVKVDLREGPAGHSSGAVGPSLTSAGRRFPECLLVFISTSTDGVSAKTG